MGGRERALARDVLHGDGGLPARAFHHPLAGPRARRAISNEIVHIVDLYTTFARVGGAEIPGDRAIDGVDQSDFFLGKQGGSNREGFPAYVADRLTAVKWRNWKMHLIRQDHMYDVPQRLPLPRIINLLSDLKEERDVLIQSGWVNYPMTKIVREFEASLERYPPVKVGTPDPYSPPASTGGR